MIKIKFQISARRKKHVIHYSGKRNYTYKQNCSKTLLHKKPQILGRHEIQILKNYKASRK